MQAFTELENINNILRQSIGGSCHVYSYRRSLGKLIIILSEIPGMKKSEMIVLISSSSQKFSGHFRWKRVI